MKLTKEKRIRSAFLHQPLDQIVNLMSRGIASSETSILPNQSFRNICLTTGRSRSVIKLYSISRHIYRAQSDKGKIEGVRRASW